jgi:hypothetical protein
MDSITLLICIPLILGISLLLTAITYRKIEAFFPFCLIISTFFVWHGLLDFSVVIVFTIISVTVVSISIYRGKD